MKVIYLFFSLFFITNIAFSGSLEEDYKELEPEINMLSIQSPAVLNLLEPYIQKGNSVATYLAASIYEKGSFVEKDEEKAFQLYLKAAEKNPLAQMAVANMYAFGRGTKVSIIDAMLYYDKVLKSNEENLKQLASEKIILLNNILETEEQIEKIEEAALQGNPNAMLGISQFCLGIEELVCAYIWLNLSQKHPAFADSVDELQKIIDELTGEMTMAQLTEAEEKLQKIQKNLSDN